MGEKERGEKKDGVIAKERVKEREAKSNRWRTRGRGEKSG